LEEGKEGKEAPSEIERDGDRQDRFVVIWNTICPKLQA
jgi:hypothetical protein